LITVTFVAFAYHICDFVTFADFLQFYINQCRTGLAMVLARCLLLITKVTSILTKVGQHW